MKVIHRQILVGFTAVFASALLASQAAVAGGCKSLDEDFSKEEMNIPQIFQTSLPSNFGDAMEPETYEFKTEETRNRGYRCRIRQNQTGEKLITRLLDIDGATVAICSAFSGATCDTPFVMLNAGRKHSCVVHSQGGVPIARGSQYRMAVQKQQLPAAAQQ
ncbi:MAG: hypothetical protein M3436_20685 [Pseudomonadota bacterium]|nr:hypothetical protein [Pseudomonadota bacterium]